MAKSVETRLSVSVSNVYLMIFNVTQIYVFVCVSPVIYFRSCTKEIIDLNGTNLVK